MIALRVSDLTVSLGDRAVLRSLDLEVGEGETVALLGPSGSGKTTLLYAVAGLLVPDAGVIEIGGAVMTPDVGPERRSVGMVFQNYALWPHLDALATVAYPLLRRGVPRPEAMRRAGELLDLMGIGELSHRRPDELSGGQQQRVGLARALAGEPKLHLFDEPTAHLDASVRHAMQAELVSHCARTGAAAVYSTHDAGEALAISDRVAVLREGQIAHVGTPHDVYDRPVDAWTAALTGPVSVLAVAVAGRRAGSFDVEIDGTVVTLDGVAPVSLECELAIRPEWAVLGGPLQGVVTGVRYLGSHTDLVIATGIGAVQIRSPGRPAVAVGERIGWRLERAWPLRFGRAG